MPLRNRSRGVSNAPHATTTASAVTVVLAAVAVEVPHAARSAFPCRRAAISTAMLSGRISQRPVLQRAPQRRDRVALGFDRAAVERAEPAVVARGPAVVRDAVRAGRRAVRVVAERPRPPGTVSVVRNMSAPGGIGYGPLRHAANGLPVWSPATPIEALGLGVVRLQLVVVDRPVGDVGAVDRPELGREPEVDLAVARAACRRRG